jgi:hypothetical protein
MRTDEFKASEGDKEMILARCVWEHELIDFFGVIPELDSFGTRTFEITENRTRLEFSVDHYSTRVTVQVLSETQPVFSAAVDVRAVRTESDSKDRRFLILDTQRGYSIKLSISGIRVEIFDSSV